MHGRPFVRKQSQNTFNCLLGRPLAFYFSSVNFYLITLSQVRALDSPSKHKMCSFFFVISPHRNAFIQVDWWSHHLMGHRLRTFLRKIFRFCIASHFAAHTDTDTNRNTHRLLEKCRFGWNAGRHRSLVGRGAARRRKHDPQNPNTFSRCLCLHLACLLFDRDILYKFHVIWRAMTRRERIRTEMELRRRNS